MIQVKFEAATGDATTAFQLLNSFKAAVGREIHVRTINVNNDNKGGSEILMRAMDDLHPKPLASRLPSDVDVTYQSAVFVSNALIVSAMLDCTLTGIFQLVALFEKMKVTFSLTEGDGELAR